MNADIGSARVVFTVPVGAAAFAPEALYLKVLEPGTPNGLFNVVRKLRILVEALVATATVAVELLKVGGNPALAADWVDSGIVINAAGLATLIELAGAHGVRIRAKSGGTAGAMAIDAWWS